MSRITIEAKTSAEKRIKEYLEQNASEVLIAKINRGVPVMKDGNVLISRKSFEGFMQYATEEARKVAEQGARCACIEDDVVFGWAIHYFEEDSIEGKLYNADGTEYAPAKKPAPKKTAKTTPKKEETPKAEPIKEEPLKKEEAKTPPPNVHTIPIIKNKKNQPISEQITLFEM